VKLSKLDRKIKKKKAQLETLQGQREDILREEEESRQEPEDTKKNKKKKKKGEEEPSVKEQVQTICHSYVRIPALFYAARKSLKEFLSPDGLDPNNYGYIKIVDGGREVYERTYYIEKMPRDAGFANTFAALYNYPYVVSNTYIEPIETEHAISMMDRRIIDLDTELTAAGKGGDRNQYRKVSSRMQDTEGWARDLESGRNRLYQVSFYFHTFADSVEQLDTMGAEFRKKALEKNMNLVSCYGVEPEAYKSGFPFNRIFHSKLGLIKTSTVKVHTMDAYSLTTIFNHTKSNFYHKNGVYMGRDLSTGRPVTLDLYDRSLEAHNVIVAGKTGTGKSATVKMFLARAADFGLKYCSIDSEPKGRQGEYSVLTKRLGGVNFQLSVGSKEIVNLFEISSELEYDESTGEEHLSLHLIDKISIIKGVIMTMITFGKPEPSFADATALDSIIGDIISYLFEIRGIREGEPESLFASTSGYQKVKKPLPTITEFYIEALKRQRDNQDKDHKQAYALLLDSMKEYVKELYYIPKVVKILRPEEYEALPQDTDGRRYYETERKEQIYATVIRGTRSYYDGQSTIEVDLNTPAVNIDISQMPANDLPIGMVIAANFLNENYIKKNSANPKRLQQRVILVDEGHRMFRYKELRIFLADLYRSARKRHIAPIISTQALSDFKGYEETENIVKQSPIIMMLRQSTLDREYLERATPLTPMQMDRMLRLGGREREDGSVADRGQICLIVNSRVSFIQVDYLKGSETEVVETNMQVIHDHIRRRREREYAQSKNH
jgi:hypothetical protein